MKKLLIFCCTAFMLLIANLQSNAQSTYKNAVGVRLGQYNGINYKTFLDEQHALDFNLSFRSKSGVKYFLLTGLYEIHDDVPEAPGLKWYYGAGASVGSARYLKEDSFLLGIDGVVGLDYKIESAPINLAIDWRPQFRVTPDTNVNGGNFGFAVRFTF